MTLRVTAGAFIEVWVGSGRVVVPLGTQRLILGKDPETDVVLDDPTVSRVHAALEPVARGWSVRDLGSRNGTMVNGERVSGERMLRHGDEVRLGNARVVCQFPETSGTPPTEAVRPAPELTRRERDVLLSLCRPVLAGSVLTEPASVREVAAHLVLTESAVKKHLSNLYDKFEIYAEDRRRAVLANEAIRRGAVTLAELRARERP